MSTVYIRNPGVITTGWAIQQSANISGNYEGIRKMIHTSSIQKGCKSSELQTTAKVNFVPVVDIIIGRSAQQSKSDLKFER